LGLAEELDISLTNLDRALWARSWEINFNDLIEGMEV
jgi:hypothetical protein